MTREQQYVDGSSLTELIQAVKKKLMADPIPPDQQWLLLQMTADMLQACAGGTEQPPPRDMQEIRGQERARRALEVAAAGGHNILLIGPPGAGKQLLAQAFPSLLPVTPVPCPFRSPHSSIEPAEFVGKMPFPGELTLAHGGVLFLNELSTFDRSLLAVVQQAVAKHTVAVSETVTYPAHFLLIATMKPCPCGFYNDPILECICSAEEVRSYTQSLHDVIDGCFDLQIEVPRISEDGRKLRPGENSAAIRRRVEDARKQQRKRYAQTPHLCVNADIRTLDEAQLYCNVDAPGEKLLSAACRQLYFSPRQTIQTLKIARTSADLAVSEIVASNHVAEAIGYRPRFGR